MDSGVPDREGRFVVVGLSGVLLGSRVFLVLRCVGVS
jgi:hypothetical protein